MIKKTLISAIAAIVILGAIIIAAKPHVGTPKGDTAVKSYNATLTEQPPIDAATPATIQASFGQKTTGLDVSVTPNKIVSDSRCPEGVQCIWAGTIEVRAALETEKAQAEHVFKIGEPFTFGGSVITLTEVTPAPKFKDHIADSAYLFTFLIQKA